MGYLILIIVSIAIGFVFGVLYETSNHNKKRLKRDDRRNRIIASSDKRVDTKMRFESSCSEDVSRFDMSDLIVYND